MREVTYQILEHIATIAGIEGQLTKQVNLISWNGRPSVVDIRAWSAKKKPYKGIVLTIAEAVALKEVLNRMEVLKNEQQECGNSK